LGRPESDHTELENTGLVDNDSQKEEWEWERG
jgi:hypothetical protein